MEIEERFNRRDMGGARFLCWAETSIMLELIQTTVKLTVPCPHHPPFTITHARSEQLHFIEREKGKQRQVSEPEQIEWKHRDLQANHTKSDMLKYLQCMQKRT